MITSTTGAVQLWQQDKLQWVREESLSSISVAEFVELPERKIALSHAGDEGETFLARITRQLEDAQVGLLEMISPNLVVDCLPELSRILIQLR
jgi:hypothetical protein